MLLFAVVPLFAWQMLLLSEETASVGLMALALLCYRQASERGKWYDWLGAGAVSGFAVTVSWWNILWPAGLLFFRLIDPQRREAWFDRRVALLIALSPPGFLPFLMWYQKMGLFPAVGRSAVHWLAAKQHAAGYGTGALVFLRNQAVWLGVGCFAALVFLLGRARDYAFLRRSQLFLLSLCVPGLLVQFLMSFLGPGEPGRPRRPLPAHAGARRERRHARGRRRPPLAPRRAGGDRPGGGADGHRPRPLDGAALLGRLLPEPLRAEPRPGRGGGADRARVGRLVPDRGQPPSAPRS